MIELVILAVSYLIADTGSFGGDVIFTIDVLENWYIFIAAIGVLLSTIVIFASTATGANSLSSSTMGSFIGAIGGYSLGSAVAVLILAKVITQIWICNYLMDNINPLATSFNDFNNNVLFGIGALVVLWVIGLTKSSDYSKND